MGQIRCAPVQPWDNGRLNWGLAGNWRNIILLVVVLVLVLEKPWKFEDEDEEENADESKNLRFRPDTD
jgi:hypothetical protein